MAPVDGGSSNNSVQYCSVCVSMLVWVCAVGFQFRACKLNPYWVLGAAQRAIVRASFCAGRSICSVPRRTSCSMADSRQAVSSSSRLTCMWKGIWRRFSSSSCSGVLSWWYLPIAMPCADCEGGWKEQAGRPAGRCQHPKGLECMPVWGRGECLVICYYY